MIPRIHERGDDVARQPAPPPPRFDQVTIGERMRDAREKRKLSRVGLIKLAGIAMGEDALRKKESGENPFYFAELSALCDALEAPRLFPIMPWGEARLADKMLGLENVSETRDVEAPASRK
jgi:transcriptional regulator with XRE-family HTH domain